MRDLVFIRTHTFGENERSLYKTLRLFFPEEAVVVCADESKRDVETEGIARVSLREEDAIRLAGGPLAPDWGWRMGDLCFARMREVYPDVGRFWLIEPDVFIPPSHVARIFGQLALVEADFLACDFGEHGRRPFNRALARLQEISGYGAVFACSRATGPAIDAALALRKRVTDALGPTPPKVPVPNDEAVMANAVAQSGLVGRDLYQVAPDVFGEDWFANNPPHLRRAAEANPDDLPRVVHPVLSVDEIVGRIMAPDKLGYVPVYHRWRLRHVLPHLTVEERVRIKAAWAASDRH